tara:strand:- start:3791 stop:4180 length:390 start_codon:yes stop_codon:yes gene_type:complete
MTVVIHPKNMPDTVSRGYSQARIDKGHISISGMVGRVGEFKPVGADMTSQARQVFANIETILAEMDKNLSDISKVTSYLIEPRKHLQEYSDVWKEVFTEEPYPCHTLIGVHQLVQEAYLVEIDVEIASG